jgi:hypothetical protein
VLPEVGQNMDGRWPDDWWDNDWVESSAEGWVVGWRARPARKFQNETLTFSDWEETGFDQFENLIIFRSQCFLKKLVIFGASPSSLGWHTRKGPKNKTVLVQ